MFQSVTNILNHLAVTNQLVPKSLKIKCPQRGLVNSLKEQVVAASVTGMMRGTPWPTAQTCHKGDTWYTTHVIISPLRSIATCVDTIVPPVD